MTITTREARWLRSVSLCSLLGLLAFGLALVGLDAEREVAAADGSYNLLTNPGLEQYDPPHGQWQGVDCQVATSWQRFWYGGFEPAWMDGRVYGNAFSGGWVERIEGDTAQFLVGTEAYTAGIFQQVNGLVPGVGYGFHAAFITIYQSSAQPAAHGTMIKQVGLDPSGGTDPLAPTVVWSEAGSRDKEWDLQQRLSVVADEPSLTVFLRVESPLAAGPWPFVNLSVLDSAILAQTPTVTTSSPSTSSEPSFSVTWDSVQMAPGGGEFRGCDVQWLDEADGAWHDWYTQTFAVGSSFVGEPGHAYRFRARAWQRYPNDAWLYSPYRPEGDSRTEVSAARLVGQVLSPRDWPVQGARIAVSGTQLEAISGPDGRYSLAVNSAPTPFTIAVRHPFWASPEPVYGVQVGPTEAVTLDWVLRPPSDAIVNGGFEDGLEGWALRSEQGVVPHAVAEPVHTGHAALSLGGTAAASCTTGVSQTVMLSGAWEPVISFWYRAANSDPADVLNVQLSVVATTLPPEPPMSATMTFTPDLDVQDWKHVWYAVGARSTALTGKVTLQLLLRDTGGEATIVHLDEISLGATPGGPNRMYLPLSARRFR